MNEKAETPVSAFFRVLRNPFYIWLIIGELQTYWLPFDFLGPLAKQEGHFLDVLRRSG